MRFKTLQEWLVWQETLHPTKIDLGLDRVATVLYKLGIKNPDYKIITVAGTNGKGSSVAMLEAILSHAGYRVGAYMSPHLIRYNERICILGAEASSEKICQAFEKIDRARGRISLTYFEFATLAALLLFSDVSLDVVILEVGLGGRLDAVNVVDADAALVTNIALDHMNWLGQDRETIAIEKAGIFRKNRPAIVAQTNPPKSLVECASKIAAPFYCLGKDFGYSCDVDSWAWWLGEFKRTALCFPILLGKHQLQNAAGVLAVLHSVSEYLPVTQQAIRHGFLSATLLGRFQVFLEGQVHIILDVAHNPAGTSILAKTLTDMACNGKTFGVVAVMQDKDVQGILLNMSHIVDEWQLGDLAVDRGLTANETEKVLKQIDEQMSVETHHSIVAAYDRAILLANPGDRIVVFGSFITVAEIYQQRI